MGKRKLSDTYKRKPRTRRNTILIGAEGNCKTEKLYFEHFKVRHGSQIKIATGNTTDPFNIVMDIIKTMANKDIKVEYGDKIYCLFDTDEKQEKNLQIRKAITLAKKHGIEVIPSNPCFEIWYLCHFEYTTKKLTNREMITQLKRYIPDYKKGLDVYDKIKSHADDGIKNAKKQCQYQKELKRSMTSVAANPCTEVYKVVEQLRKSNKG